MPLLDPEQRDCAGHEPLYPTLALTEDGLVRGAATVLAKIGRSAGQNPELAADNAGERILALLAVAYRQPVPSTVLGNIRRAVRYWRAGTTGWRRSSWH
jgi:hypothetical protein